MLVLVRHGQTAPNADGVLLGRADPHLNELGRLQAAALASALGRPGRVVSSPLVRARETAAAFGLPVQVDPRWIEVDYGVYDLAPLGDGVHEVWRRWRDDPAFAPPGGESLVSVGRRVRTALEELADEAADGDVVVVSHVSPIKAAVAWALGVADEVALRMRLDVAAVCRVAVGSTGPVLRSFNERVGPEALGSPAMSSTTLTIPGIHCDHCKSSIEGALNQLDGVHSAEVSVDERTVAVEYDESAVDVAAIKDAIIEQGYDLPA